MSRPLHVSFVNWEPASKPTSAAAAPGQTVLEAARAAQLEIVATCGGRGTCRSCRVKILEGDVPPPTVQDRIQLGHDAVRERFRLSCQTTLVSDCTVLIAPPQAESGHQILGAGTPFTSERSALLNSGVDKHLIVAEAAAPEHHQASDVDRIAAALPEALSRDFPLDVLRKIPAVLRKQKGLITVTAFDNAVIDVEAGDTREQKYGMAIDLGTTTIVGTLLDLDSGEQVAEACNLNPQAAYGGDLVSRIAFVQFDEKNLAILRARALNAINDLITETCKRANVASGRIYKIVMVGNTCMHHIFLGIDVSYIGLAPYAPVVRRPVVFSAKELPLKAAPNARVCLLPNVGGFVGADAIGAIIATRLYESDKIRLVVDIGTNTEVAMGSRDKLMACSAPAGPAFEGGQIKHGMRAAVGAIERVDIDQEVRCKTIGGAAPIGICGSGLIDAVAKMLDAGLLDSGGALCEANRKALPPNLRNRVRDTEHGPEFVIVRADQSGKNEDITITQADIRQLQLAKGAIYSAILMLQRVMGIKDEQIEEVMLCGAFGNYMNIASALRIRLLPPLPLEKVTYVGNAAHAGAAMALLSETVRNQASAIAQRIEHVGLAEQPGFQELFVDALSLAADGEAR